MIGVRGPRGGRVLVGNIVPVVGVPKNLRFSSAEVVGLLASMDRILLGDDSLSWLSCISSTFLFPGTTGLGGGASSGSESSVRSMIVLAFFEAGAALLLRVSSFTIEKLINGAEIEGESSCFTRPSSSPSLSESESSTTTSSEAVGLADDVVHFCFGDDSLLSSCDGGKLRVSGAAFALLERWVIVHVSEPYVLSLVCHSPSGSTSTSSTLSGVCFKISSK